jgi:hypothetical protein
MKIFLYDFFIFSIYISGPSRFVVLYLLNLVVFVEDNRYEGVCAVRYTKCKGGKLNCKTVSKVWVWRY